MKIGVFDSGIGGLSVLHQAIKALPREHFIYYADEQNVPYGEKEREEIISYVDQAIQFMINQGVQAVVVACNTATSAAIDIMRSRYSIPIIGMEPAVKKAIDTYGEQRVLVAATPITVKGEKMKVLLEKVDKEHLVDLVALPQLVHFAEQEIYDTDEVVSYLQEMLSQYSFDQYSSIVLGCTHFNYFKDSFRKLLPDSMHFIDGNEGTIRRLISELQLESDVNHEMSGIDYYYSGVKVEDKNELDRLQRYMMRLERMLYIN